MNADGIPGSVLTWAARPGAAALLVAARGKVESGRSGPGTRLPVAAEHRADVGRMLGVRWELSGKPATLAALRAAMVRADTDLESVLVAVGGRLRNIAEEKAQAQALEREHRTRTLAALTSVGIDETVAQMALRWVGPLEGAEAVVAQVTSAWLALPVRPGEVAEPSTRRQGLAEFAGRVLGDPHALDRDTFSGRTVVRAAAATAALFEHSDTSAPEDGEVSGKQLAAAAAADALRAREWRAAWAGVGIWCDQVSSTVMVLNLPLTGPNAALAQVTSVLAEPVWVTSRMTSGGCTVAPAVRDEPLLVRVCENPSVMEAAAEAHGAACPPLLCLYGRPSGAAWDVLEAVVRAGGRLLVSADRDTAGLQITEEVALTYPSSAVDCWLPDVEGLYEEQRLPDLLADLAGV